MSRFLPFIVLCLLWLVGTVAAAEPQSITAQVSAEDSEFFERKIRPLLSQQCFDCHSARAETQHGGLRLDTAGDLREGGDSGPIIASAGDADHLLISAIDYRGDIKMPPEGKLPEAEIELLRKWVERGAPFPPSDDPPTRSSGGVDLEAGRTFWSFQPLSEQPLPEISLASWPRQRIDAFVLAAMQEHDLIPAVQADRTTLIRRLSFDLTGLPPTPQQVHEFVTDDAPHAYERLVERLLQSPQHGERWARMWLDMARYTDKTASWLYKTGQAHLYRDWVVKAFNDDMPYNEFVHRQLATDMMSETGPDDLAALGFLGLSPTYWKELKLPCEIIKVIVADEWEERVDAVSRTFLGLTVACARCHDHKFDPISSEDYYALAGVFASCRLVERPLISDQLYEPVRVAKSEVEKLEAEIAKLRKAKPPPKEKLESLTAKVDEIKTSTPWYDTPMANGVAEESMYVVRAGKLAEEGTLLKYKPGPRDLPLFVRGNPNRPGPIVPRRFLSVLSEQPQPFAGGSGRLELARAITTDSRGLAARVIVNRIWRSHFGQGIVTTPSNFGQQGGRPSHPRLLNDLAARFVAGGWSIKNLHREIVCSATWRQSSRFDAEKAEIDPDNRWLSRTNRRRLDFESWRDAMLIASGRLDQSIGGQAKKLDAADNVRRTLYASIHRRDMSTTLQIHDFPDPTSHSPGRSTTTTALQGLYALNGPLITSQAKSLFERLEDQFGDDETRIEQAYRLLFLREPSQRELDLGLRFLGDAAGQQRAAAWNQYAHMLLASNEFLFVD
jgi:hypothetical protein